MIYIYIYIYHLHLASGFPKIQMIYIYIIYILRQKLKKSVCLKGLKTAFTVARKKNIFLSSGPKFLVTGIIFHHGIEYGIRFFLARL